MVAETGPNDGNQADPGRGRLWAMWQRLRYYVVFQILHADDPPHRLALGIAIGVFVTFTPTIGAQMLLVLLLSWMLRANKAVGLPIVWISNPVSMVPIFWGCYTVGVQLLGLEAVDSQWWSELANPPDAWLDLVRFFWARFLEIATPLWLGSLVVALALAVPSYFLSRWGITAYRWARWGQLTPPKPALTARKDQGEEPGRVEDHAVPSRPSAESLVQSSGRGS